jgi:hypothetical protein
MVTVVPDPGRQAQAGPGGTGKFSELELRLELELVTIPPPGDSESESESESEPVAERRGRVATAGTRPGPPARPAAAPMSGLSERCGQT